MAEDKQSGNEKTSVIQRLQQAVTISETTALLKEVLASNQANDILVAIVKVLSGPQTQLLSRLLPEISNENRLLIVTQVPLERLNVKSSLKCMDFFALIDLPEGWQRIRQMLAHEDPTLRAKAIELLGGTLEKKPEYMKVLSDHYRQEKEITLRQQMVNVLLACPHPDAIAYVKMLMVNFQRDEFIQAAFKNHQRRIRIQKEQEANRPPTGLQAVMAGLGGQGAKGKSGDMTGKLVTAVVLVAVLAAIGWYAYTQIMPYLQ